MANRRLLMNSPVGFYHVMTRTVNGERLFKSREKEVLRKMLWQVADFCGVEVLTYCLMENHFHVLVRVEAVDWVPDAELMRRYRVLYPKPTKYKTAEIRVLAAKLAAGGPEAEAIRAQLLRRMGDVSQFMSTLKQRFSIWFNNTHDRFGTLWAERFKSVLVQGEGNPLQTMAAYIDLNPVRAGLVEDPKDYRFCGYSEAVAGDALARRGLLEVWGERVGGARRHGDSRSPGSAVMPDEAAGCGTDGGNFADGSMAGGEIAEAELLKRALAAHRRFIFSKGGDPWTRDGVVIDRKQAVRVLEKEHGVLPMPVMLRCRVRYFTDGAILGTSEFVQRLAKDWQKTLGRKKTPAPQPMTGTEWGNLSVIRRLKRNLFT